MSKFQANLIRFFVFLFLLGILFISPIIWDTSKTVWLIGAVIVGSYIYIARL